MTIDIDFQNRCRQFVAEHVIYSANSMVYEVSKVSEHLDAEDQETLMELTVSYDYETAAQDEGWQEAKGWWVFEGIGIKAYEESEYTDSEAWAKLCEEEGIATDEYDEPEEAAGEDGWSMLEDVQFFNLDTDETSEEETWKDLCYEQGIDPQEDEIFEHYVVDGFLARRLSAHGEVVRDLFDMTIWGRGTTGQAIYIDGVIEAIVREVEAEEASYR